MFCMIGTQSCSTLIHRSCLLVKREQKPVFSVLTFPGYTAENGVKEVIGSLRRICLVHNQNLYSLSMCMLQLDSPQKQLLDRKSTKPRFAMPTKASRSFTARERHLCDGTRVFLFLVWLSRALILTDIGVLHEDTAGTICRRHLLVSTKTGEPSRRPSPGCTLSSRGLIVVLG